MQRKEFENRIKSLLPKAADDVVESWAEYATELDQDGTEAAADFYDKNYIALLLVKQRRGEEIATQLLTLVSALHSIILSCKARRKSWKPAGRWMTP